MRHTASFDVVVFGSGFAAWELTRQLSARDRRVLVVERGGRDLAEADPAVSRVPATRDPVRSGGFDFGVEVPAAFEGLPRYIGLGGTSELWSGKWRRLDRLDFRRVCGARSWPLGYDDVGPWYDAVAADYGWPEWSDDGTHRDHRRAVAAHDLRLVDIYEEQPPVRLRPRWLDLERAGGVEIASDARILRARFDDAGGRLQSVRIATLAGERDIVAGVFVVACGGIESIHVSHALRSSRRGVALARRYSGFADHPKAFVGDLVPADARLLEHLEHCHRGQRRLIAFALPEDELLEAGIGNHTVFVTPAAGVDAGSSGPWRLMISLEQFPEPDNWIDVSPPAVNWHVSAQTRADARAFLERFTPRLESILGRIRLDRDVEYRGASHHAAALPIGEAARGVVDGDCRFHDVANLYCVSSAVFPIAGSANPTMTIVALARRLAETLAQGVRKRPTGPFR